VGELGEGDAFALALDALSHAFLLDHGIDGEMLPDVPQDGQDVELRGPVEVIDDQSGPLTAVEVYKVGELPLDLLCAGFGYLGRVQLALRRHEVGISEYPGSSSRQRDGAVAGKLGSLQSEQAYEIADMKTVGRGIDASINAAAYRSQMFVVIGLGRDL